MMILVHGIQPLAFLLCNNYHFFRDIFSHWLVNLSSFSSSSELGDVPPLCNDENEIEAYYQPLRSCISGTASRRWVPIQNKSHLHVEFQLNSAELEVHGRCKYKRRLIFLSAISIIVGLNQI